MTSISVAGHVEQALGIFLGEIRDGENPRRLMQHPLGELEVQRALHPGGAVDPVQVVEQIVHRNHVGARNGLRLPEQMRHMQQVAAVMLEDAMQLQVAVDRKLVGMRGNGDEVGRQWLDVAQLSREAEQKVFRALVEARQGANGVAGVGAHAKLVDPPDVDGDAHKFSVNRRAKRAPARLSLHGNENGRNEVSGLDRVWMPD